MTTPTKLAQYVRTSKYKAGVDERAIEKLREGSIFEFFSKTPYSQNLLSRFRAIGIITLGDLVSYHEKDLFSKVAATSLARKRIRETLNEVGLDFAGNKIPSPERYIRAVDSYLQHANIHEKLHY